MTMIYLNDTFVEDTQAKISVHDRSFLFGEGLFETFVSMDGKIPFLKDHLNRLEWSCTHLGFSLPEKINFSEICQELLKKNNFKNSRFKIVLSSQNCVVFCEPHDDKEIPPTYRLKIIKNRANDALPLSALKTTNYLTKISARADAKEAGFDDGILSNAKGQATETTTGNIFWVDKNGLLFTIMSECGLLDGITKKNLLKLFQEKGLKIKESMITAEELSNQREVFVTNSVIGIKPVVQIDKRQISGGEAGPITAMIQDLWKTYLKDLTS
jgi:branched-subunit amino acid aminotransferase/4-amino-4-deoxychorismate lyase